MARFKVSFNDASFAVPVQFGVVHVVTDVPEANRYEGDYVITPKVEAQTIPTAQKFLTNDMTVKSIPRYDVSNTAGGTTVYIGKELE